MRFYIDNLLVLFPYDYIYPEQLEYMRSLKEGLDKRGHLVLEMPSGTGKTISLMSLLVAYHAAHSNTSGGLVKIHKQKQQQQQRHDAATAVKKEATAKKQFDDDDDDDDGDEDGDVEGEKDKERIRVVYCTRTVAEMVKAAGELKRLVAYWNIHEPGNMEKLTAICMSARKNLCANADVARLTYGSEVDAACRQVTSEWSQKKCPLFASIDVEDIAVMAAAGRQNKAPPPLPSYTTAAAAAAAAQQQQKSNNGNLRDMSADLFAAPAAATASSTSAARKPTDSKLHVPAGVHDVDGLLNLGLERGVCPYLMARHAVMFEADIVISSFLYIVDPKVSPSVTQHMPPQTIVILDEGHNVDDVCIEALSMVISRADTSIARNNNMRDLENGVNKMRAENRQKLAEEFQRIAVGRDLVPNATFAAAAAAAAAGNGNNNATAALNTHAALIPKDLLDKAVPAPLKQLNHFLPLLSKIVEFFHRFICRMTYAQVADPLTFLTKVRDECQTDIHHLRFLSGRLSTLIQTLQIEDVHRFRHITLIADFVTTLATHLHAQADAAAGALPSHQQRDTLVFSGAGTATAGGSSSSSVTAQFAVICEPHDIQNPNLPDPVIKLACLDASLAMKDVFERFDSVVLTSGTLSPLHLPPKMLGFKPVVARSLPMTLSRRCIAPLIVTRSADQASLEDVALSSSFKVRKDVSVNKHVLGSYASLLKNLAQVVPDGICCFFTGYAYMNEVLSEWHANGFLRELSEHKLIFIETQGVEETARQLANFRRACDMGRGAIFFSIARGKIAEGIDFDRHYGRAVLMFGVPFLPPVDRGLNERLKWMQNNLGVSDTEYRSFDAMRQAAQCIGRVIRNKTDYGLMLLVDRRFGRPELRRKLPEWIASCIEANGNLSTESAVTVARRFFREMAQPWDKDAELGNTLLDISSITARGFHQPQQVPKSIRLDRRSAAVVPAPAAAGAGTAEQRLREANGEGEEGGEDREDDPHSGAVMLDVGDGSFKGARAPGSSAAASSSGAGAKRRGRSPPAANK